MWPHRRQPTRLPRPWDSPGKNTGVGCHFLLQCVKVKVKSLSHSWLLATPWPAAYQAPLSMGFSRQEHWSGVPFPSPMRESESEVSQSCPTLSDPMACSLPGSSVPGIFQARVLEWVPLNWGWNILVHLTSTVLYWWVSFSELNIIVINDNTHTYSPRLL